MQILIFLVTSSLAIIGVIALYLHLAGFSRRGRIADTKADLKTAKDKLQAAHPESAIIDFKITPSHTTAFAQFKDGSGRLLYAMGRNWIVHPLGPESVRSITSIQGRTKNQGQTKNNGLRIRFNDYTAPNLKIYLGDETASAAWRIALGSFIKLPVK